MNIECFIGELTPIVHKIGKECAYALILGDFNIDLLQINEREKFSDFFEMLCTISFYLWDLLCLRVLLTDHAA